MSEDYKMEISMLEDELINAKKVIDTQAQLIKRFEGFTKHTYLLASDESPPLDALDQIAKASLKMLTSEEETRDERI